MIDPANSANISAGTQIRHGFDLAETLSFIWRQWKFIAAINVVTFLIGAVLLLNETPLFTATSQVLLNTQQEKVIGSEKILTDVDLDMAMMESQMSIIKSTVLLRRVVEKEHLVPLPPSVGPNAPIAATKSPSIVESVFSLLRNWWPEEAKAEPSSVPVTVGSDAVAPEELQVIADLRSRVTVTRPGQQGYVLAISVTSPTPAQAAQLANAVTDAYLVDKLDTRFEAARRASAWLSDRLVGLRQQLREAEEAVTQFRVEHGLVQSGNGTLNQQQLSELNAKLVDAKADLAQKKARVDLISSIVNKGGSLQNLTDVANAGALPALRQQLATFSAQEADLLARYGASHPLVVNIRAQIRDVERSIGGETQRLAGSVRSEYDLAQARVASLEKSFQAATGQSNLDDASAIRLRELERTAAVNKTLFEDFLQRAKVTDEQATFHPQEVRIITPALPPGGPSYPRKTQYLIISALIGLALGVGGAVGREILNTGFTTPKQVEDLLGLPLLCSVTQLKKRDLVNGKENTRAWEYPALKPLSRYSEAIRSLRSGIQMTDVDHPPKVIQVTSAVPGEGKTTIGMSLATSAGLAKLKVLFIDADLRHPTATRACGLEEELGLVDVLLGEVAAPDAIRYQADGGYWLLGGGSKTQNPTDLLSSERMKTVVASFKNEYDLVIIDTPPAGPVMDPIVVSHLSDKVVLVVRWGVTARELVEQCVAQLSGHRKVAGVAFNRVDERQAQKYGYYGYHYGTHNYTHYYAH